MKRMQVSCLNLERKYYDLENNCKCKAFYE